MDIYVKRQRADVRRETSKVKRQTGYPSDRFERSDGYTEHETERIGTPNRMRDTLFTHHVSRITFCLLLAAACLLALSGCGNSFEPFEENDAYHFTIYGYLDASADTQFVRVEPARQELDTPAEVPDIRVTLEELESGETIVLNDSLDSVGGFNFINYWTTMDIENLRTYRLTAERSDAPVDRRSRVTVTTPGELPVPRVSFGGGIGIEPAYTVYVDDTVEHLIDVQSKWYVRIYGPGYEERRVVSFSHRNEVETTEVYGGVYFVEIRPEQEEERISQLTNVPPEGGIEILDRQIFVASGGPDWNEEIPSMDDVLYALPETFSNVENGLGYLVGIDSKTIPMQMCRDADAVLIPCPEEEPYW